MDTALLTEQINRVTALFSQDIKNNRLELPSPPDMLVNIRKLATDPETDSQDIADLVKHDVNISARLIKVANSALFTSRTPVSTVKAAITRLGSKKVQALVTGLIIGQQLIKAKTKGLETFCETAWKDSNTVAVLSYILAQKKSTLDPERALLAGMVHNIGVLPLLIKLNSIKALREDPKMMALIAKAVIPKLYQPAGKLIMKNWHFSQDMIDIAHTHNEIDRQSTGPVDLNDTILVSVALNRLNGALNLEQVPEQLVESSTFKKFWLGWASAVHELSEIEEQITQIQHEIVQ